MGQQALNGAFVGSIYALFAVGYTLVFGVLDILNLAHAAVFTLAAFIALALVDAHLPLWLALPLAVAAAGLIGIVLERLAFRPLRGRTDSNISGLISSLAMATVFEAIALQIFGPDTSRFPQGTFPDRMIRIGGATASLLQLCIIVIALAFFLSSALGGAAGVLFGLAFNSISPDVGRSVELKGLAVIILGGMGSVPGALVAGFALGLIEVFTVAHLGSSFRDAVSFAVLFLVLIARPHGLFGRAAAREA